MNELDALDDGQECPCESRVYLTRILLSLPSDGEGLSSTTAVRPPENGTAAGTAPEGDRELGFMGEHSYAMRPSRPAVRGIAEGMR